MIDAKAYAVAEKDADRFVRAVNAMMDQAEADEVAQFAILECAAFLVAVKAGFDKATPEAAMRTFVLRVYANYVDIASGGVKQ